MYLITAVTFTTMVSVLF